MREVSRKSSKQPKNQRKLPPAKTPEEREDQLINLAMSFAEEKMRDGTASSQIVTYFLKLAGLKEKLENEKLRADVQLANAKIDQIKQAADIKILYEDALNAMKYYSGEGSDEDYEDYEALY